MRFPPSFLDDIKTRLPVSEVVRQRVKLTKSGREWKGLSPFNAEKTPSFFVNDAKMAWFDLSAGKNGNIFDFVMETEGLSFPEAVERLAADAGLALPQVSPQAEAHERQRTGLIDVMELAAAYFSAQLNASAGTGARAYLARRGLEAPIQSQFRLGYAGPEKYALRDHLAGKGVPAKAMIEAGLLIHGEDIAVPYDRFRDRIMFPICDRSGRVIAFGGRALAKDAQAKYLNSPETELFHKGSILYNHHNARKAAHETGQIIVVEGYVDVISMSAAGFAGAVAPLGTALTPSQCELLWKMAEEPVLCFDGDKAGVKAAYRAIEMVLPLIGPGRSLRFALLPEGSDPDDLVRSGGRDAMSAVLGEALPLADLIWRREFTGADLTTPEKKAGLERRLDEIAREITDETLRRYYRDDFRDRLARQFARAGSQRFAGRGPRWTGARNGASRGASFNQTEYGQDAGNHLKVAPQIGRSLAQSPLLRPGAGALPPREALILLILINHPELLERHVEALADLEFSSREAGGARDRLLDFAGSAAAGRSPRAALEDAGFSGLIQKLDLLAAHASHWCVKAEAAEADAEEVLKQALTLHHRAKALNRELHLAELALGKESSEANLARLKDIQEQLLTLGGTEAAVEGFGDSSKRLGTAM
ncbi:DNA primase [Methylocapsa palsarum]|uniref:DNA primase n=1 Tax=Methylocapsa palsarum TaxID=1612308 RepID=A0A1I4AGH7_9HYPH|nr:DNA primase [Methylocapsa palsarum]SFK54896.1 DNA primase [Methylocapsa palsarum]